MLKILFLLAFIIVPKLGSASNYGLELFMHIIEKKSITYQDSNKHILFDGSANSKDSDGDYAIMKCLATITTFNTNNVANLSANYEAKNNSNEKFWLNLTSSSDMIASRLGIATYLYGEGKYKEYVEKKCNYAVKYFLDRMFYKQP